MASSRFIITVIGSDRVGIVARITTVMASFNVNIVDITQTIMYEMENGEITQVRKIKDPRPVEEYLRVQKRFKHLFTMVGGEEEIKKIQAMADWNIKHFGLQ